MKPHIRLHYRETSIGLGIWYLKGRAGKELSAFSVQALFFNPFSNGWLFVLENS